MYGWIPLEVAHPGSKSSQDACWVHKDISESLVQFHLLNENDVAFYTKPVWLCIAFVFAGQDLVIFYTQCIDSSCYDESIQGLFWQCYYLDSLWIITRCLIVLLGNQNFIFSDMTKLITFKYCLYFCYYLVIQAIKVI